MHRRCQSLVAESCSDDHAEILPEICQKLRYTQPHVASRLDPQQRLSQVWLCGHVRSCEGS
jgi:hypothetical protein